MSLSQAEFDSMVSRLERAAARRPLAYRLRLGAFATLGYLYVFAILALLVLLIGVLIAVLFVAKGLALIIKKLVIPVAALIGIVARSLWVRLESPGGLEIDRESHAALFAVIDEVRTLARAPSVHKVLLIDEHNAAVVQIPRLGLFGWQRNYLLLGLSLLELTTVEEFKAIIAHEFGHLSGAHGRFGAWIYRVRTFWAKLAEVLERENHWGSFLFVPFFAWYAPRFAAWSFVCARQQEYEADRLSAESVGVQHSVNALLRTALKGDELGRHFWPGVFSTIDANPEPDARPFHELSRPERREFLPDAPQTLETALGYDTSTADTHPCLRERIRALTTQPALLPPEPMDRSAAEVLLGPALDRLIEHFDASWRSEVSPWWRRRHAQLSETRKRLSDLQSRALNDAELEEFAGLTRDMHGDESAFSIFEELLRRQPHSITAQFECGRILLARGDKAGIALIDEAMSREPKVTLAGCEAIVVYLRAHDREAEIGPYVDRYRSRFAEEQGEREKRETILTSDRYFPASLSPESVAQIVSAIERQDGVKCAYLVERKYEGQDVPQHVVGIEAKPPWHRLESADFGRHIVVALANNVELSAQVAYISLNGDNRAFRKVFRNVRGSRIFPR